MYHVKQRCVSEKRGSPVYAPMHGGFEICGRRSSDADDWLHGDIKKQETRPANLQGDKVRCRRREGASKLVY
jgi:hypothetical protein